MDRAIRKSALLWLLLLCVVPVSLGQNLCTSNGGSVYCDPPQTGVTPLGSYSGGPFDHVNNGNLNVGFTIPIFSRPGRGMSFSFALAYSSWVWSPVYSSVGNTMKWQPVTDWGWSTKTQLTGFYTFQQSQPGTCAGHSTAIKYTNWAYHDTLGTIHDFPLTLWNVSQCGATSTTGVLTTDGSGYKLIAQTTPAVSATVQSRSGTTITSTANSGTVVDSNGNTFTFNGSAIYDTQSATTPVLTISTQTNSTTYTYPNAQGGTSSVTVNYSPYTIQTNSGCTGYIEYPATAVSLVSSITLPDTRQYVFTYQPTPGFPNSVTGRIKSITLPTGAVNTYNYPIQYIRDDMQGDPLIDGVDTWCMDGVTCSHFLHKAEYDFNI